MSEINKDNFIEVLKYNGWLCRRNDLYFKDSYLLDMAILELKQADTTHAISLNQIPLSTILVQVPQHKFIDEFINICVDYLKLKPLPKIETLEDYVKANFKLLEGYGYTYLYKNFQLFVDDSYISVRQTINDNQIGSIYNSAGVLTLEQQIKILNAFLGREDEN